MITINNQKIEIKHFPDQTLLLHLEPIEDHVIIQWNYENNEEFLALQMLTLHLKPHAKSIELFMPYLPNARQDRVKNVDDVFTLKHFATLINFLEFNCVKVLDVHSSVAFELIHKLEEISVLPFINKAIEKCFEKKQPLLFFPDLGAYHRYKRILPYNALYGEKIRDWETGKIKGLEIKGDMPKGEFDILIIDDISSYGGTFYHSAKKLKEMKAKNIQLYVTHAENSILKGDLISSGLLSKIYTTNSIFTGEHPLIEVIGE